MRNPHDEGVFAGVARAAGVIAILLAIIIVCALLCSCTTIKWPDGKTMRASYPYRVQVDAAGVVAAEPSEHAINGMTALGLRLIDRLSPEAAAQVATESVETLSAAPTP